MAKREPVTCTIETDTTTIEVVATEALIPQDDDDDQENQVITMATNTTSSSSNVAAHVKVESEILTNEYGHGEEHDDDGQTTTSTTMYASVLDAVTAMDAEDLLEAVGLKILKRYSLWDLMLTKARGPDVDGVLPLLISDTERVLLELKILLESTMDFVPPRVGRKKKNLDTKELNVTELLGAALCVDPGVWRMKNIDDIHYDGPMLEIRRLLPGTNAAPVTSEVLGSANVITDLGEPLATGTNCANSILGHGGVSVRNERVLNEESEVKVKSEPGYAVSSSGRRIKRKTCFNDEADRLREDPGPRRRGRPRKGKFVGEGTDPKHEGKPYYASKFKEGIQGNEENQPKSTAKAKKARLKYRMVENTFACQYSDCTKLDVRYKRRSEFEQHFLDYHATDEHKFIPCLVRNCGEMFALTSQRNSHMDEKHER